MSTAVPIRGLIGARRPRRWSAVLAVGAPVVFAGAQVALELHRHDLLRALYAAHHIPLPDLGLYELSTSVGYSLILYAGIAFGGIVLALRGYRFAWTAPAVIFILGTAIGVPHFPQPVGVGWNGPQAYGGVPVSHWFAQLWGGSLLDLVLVLLTALPFLRPEAERHPRWRPRSDDVIALLVVGAAVAIVLRTTAVVNNSGPPPVVLGAACAFALLAGTARPWWPWATVLVSLAVVGTLGSLLWVLIPIPGGGSNPASVWTQTSGLLMDGLPVAGCALVASLWDRLAGAMRWTMARPMSLLVTVNALNMADAVLTRFAVSAGSAVELNPVVRLIGLPAKLVLVGLLSWLLYRRRPATLLLPALALLVVLVYHVSGLIIDS